eukprot:1622658-Alexandrium_andersonii.AAC.1
MPQPNSRKQPRSRSSAGHTITSFQTIKRHPTSTPNHKRMALCPTSQLAQRCDAHAPCSARARATRALSRQWRARRER